MKRTKLLLVAILVVAVFTITGCNKDDPTKDFKNPKTITVETSKGKTEVSYDDDGTYEEDESGDEKILKSSDNNFRLAFEYQDMTSKEAETTESNFKKDKNSKVISNIEFHGYEGFAIVNTKYASAQVYLYLDKENDVVFTVQISPMKTNETLEELEKASNPEDVLYNKEQVQQILSTITYSKEK